MMSLCNFQEDSLPRIHLDMIMEAVIRKIGSLANIRINTSRSTSILVYRYTSIFCQFWYISGFCFQVFYYPTPHETEGTSVMIMKIDLWKRNSNTNTYEFYVS